MCFYGRIKLSLFNWNRNRVAAKPSKGSAAALFFTELQYAVKKEKYPVCREKSAILRRKMQKYNFFYLFYK